MPYRARVNERTLLNLPGFHAAAFVYVYVEDTSRARAPAPPDCADDCTAAGNFEPRMTLEIADCSQRIELAVRHRLERGRDNSLHKLDTLVSALRLFREALVSGSSRTTGAPRARSATAGVKPGTGPAPTRRRVTRGCGETRQTHRSQNTGGATRWGFDSLHPHWQRCAGSHAVGGPDTARAGRHHRARRSTRSSTPPTARCSAAAGVDGAIHRAARAGDPARSAGCSAAARPARRGSHRRWAAARRGT